jgi:hypothetical protein
MGSTWSATLRPWCVETTLPRVSVFTKRALQNQGSSRRIENVRGATDRMCAKPCTKSYSWHRAPSRAVGQRCADRSRRRRAWEARSVERVGHLLSSWCFTLGVSRLDKFGAARPASASSVRPAQDRFPVCYRSCPPRHRRIAPAEPIEVLFAHCLAGRS